MRCGVVRYSTLCCGEKRREAVRSDALTLQTVSVRGRFANNAIAHAPVDNVDNGKTL
jgi:hypothetical protein